MAESVVVKQERELQEDVPSLDSPETQQVDAGPLGLVLPVKFEPDTDNFIKREIEMEISPTEFMYNPLSLPAPQFEEPVKTEVIQSQVFKRPFTNAENCKNYRNRKKENFAQGSKLSANEVLNTPSTSNSQMTFELSPQPVTTGAELFGNNKSPCVIIKNHIQLHDKQESNYPQCVLIRNHKQVEENNHPPFVLIRNHIQLQENKHPPHVLIRNHTQLQENNNPAYVLIRNHTQLQDEQQTNHSPHVLIRNHTQLQENIHPPHVLKRNHTHLQDEQKHNHPPRVIIRNHTQFQDEQKNNHPPLIIIRNHTQLQDEQKHNHPPRVIIRNHTQLQDEQEPNHPPCVLIRNHKQIQENNNPASVLISNHTQQDEQENKHSPHVLIRNHTQLQDEQKTNHPLDVLKRKHTQLYNEQETNHPPDVLKKKHTQLQDEQENNHPPHVLIKNHTQLQDPPLVLLRNLRQLQGLPTHRNRKPYMCKSTIKKQARKLIYSVYRYMEKESKEGGQNIKQVFKRTAAATNASYNTIRRIVKEGNSKEIFKTPGKKRGGKKPVTGLDEFEQSVMKRAIHTFHRTYKEFPTIGNLVLKFREDKIYQGCESSLRRITKNLGFRWKKTETNKKVLIEKNNIRLKRIKYLQAIRKYRQEGRPIVYTDKLYIHASYDTSKYQCGVTKLELKQSTSKGQCVVIVHAGSETGFVPNALLSFKTESNPRDCHGALSFNKYEKWFETQLIPNLPPNAVIVVDSASYKRYSAQLTSNSKKSEMQSWLTEKGIHFDVEMLKPQLYSLMKNNKKHSIDKILAQNNHSVLSLPPYHPDLNPIKMAWADVKAYVSAKYIKGNLDCVIKLVEEKVNAMGPGEWQKLCEEVIKLEEEYSISDSLVDDLTEELVMSLDNDTDSGSEVDSD